MPEDDFLRRRQEQLAREGIKRATDDTPIDNMEITARASDFLKKNGFQTVGEICAKTVSQWETLVATKKENRLIVRDIQFALKRIGRTFKTE